MSDTMVRLNKYVDGIPVRLSDAEWQEYQDRQTAVAQPAIAYVPVPLFRQRLEKLGLFEDFAGYLAQNPVLMLKVLSLETGIDPDYPDLHTAFTSMSVPQDTQDYLLAPPSVGVPDV